MCVGRGNHTKGISKGMVKTAVCMHDNFASGEFLEVHVNTSMN